jgi:hypothetical protein
LIDNERFTGVITTVHVNRTAKVGILFGKN